MGNPVYTATFAAQAVAAAQDLFEIVAPAAKRVQIMGVDIGQYSDAGDTQAEMLSIQIILGYTTSGSGGGSVTPQNTKSGGKAATSSLERNNTTLAQTGTAKIIIATAFNVQAGWIFRPHDVSEKSDDIIELAPSERMVVRITAPNDEVTINGTIKFREIIGVAGRSN